MVRQNPHTGHTSVMQLNHRAFKHIFALVRVPSLPACPQEKNNRRTETRNRVILELEHRRNGTDKFI